MEPNAAVVDQLRSARHADDVLEALRSGSQEARRDRIAEALNSSRFEAGPAELLYTYPHHVICRRDDVIMQVRVHESEAGEIQLGNVEVHSVPDAIPDVVDEVMETARAAVPFILDEEFDNARPLVASIANALSCKGGLRDRVQAELAKKTVARDAWWHRVAQEHLGENVDVELPQNTGALSEDVDALRSFLESLAAEASDALTQLDEAEVKGPIESVAYSIADDLRYAISALESAPADNQAEMTGVYEGVYGMTTNLALGARFLTTLAREHQEPEDEE